MLRELVRCRGLPGRAGVLDTRVDSDVKMSAVLGVGMAGRLKSSTSTSPLLTALLGCLCANDLAAALPGLISLRSELRGRLVAADLFPSALLSLPLLSREGVNRLARAS